jgi:hypothetical protein
MDRREKRKEKRTQLHLVVGGNWNTRLHAYAAGSYNTMWWVATCDNPPRKIPYYRLNQSTLVIKQ